MDNDVTPDAESDDGGQLNDAFPELSQFCGSLTRYKHHWMLLTPGALYVARNFDGWWLIDFITSLQLEPHISMLEFQVWRLVCSADERTATLTCTDGNSNLSWREPVFTDFRRPGIELWVEDLVIHLPEEH